MMINRNKGILALSMLSLVYVGCADDYNFTAPVRTFAVTPLFTVIDDGTNVQLGATTDGTAGGTAVPVTWTSSNTAVISVNASGLATAVAPGLTTVVAASVANPSETSSASITVNALQGISLTKGVPVTGLSGPTGDQKLYRIFVPVGTTNLTVTLSGGPGDADIYVRRATPPTNASFTFFSFNGGNGELISVTNPQSGTWYILVDAFETYSGATLTATYTP